MNMQMLAALFVALLAHTSAGDTSNVVNAASSIQQGLLNTKYSQRAERDADHGGSILMTKAGYQTAGMLTFMEYLRDQERRSPEFEPGIFRDHPLTEDRIAAIRAQLTAMGADISPGALAKRPARPARSVTMPSSETSQIATQRHLLRLRIRAATARAPQPPRSTRSLTRAWPSIRCAPTKIR